MGKGEAYSILSAALWAYGVILYQRLGRHVSPSALNLQKNLVVLALVLPLCLPEIDALRALGWQALGVCLVSGAIGIALADTLYFRALNRLGAGRMGILGNLYSPFVILLSFLFLGERLELRQVVGFALVSGGVLIVSHAERDSPLSRGALWRGIGMGVAAVVLMACAIVMIKRPLDGAPVLPVAGVRLVGGVAGLLIAHGIGARGDWRTQLLPPAGQRWLLLKAAVVGQFLAMLAWLSGYKHANASVAAILNESASVFIVLFAWLLLKEPLGTRKLLGIGCTLGGVACMLVRW